MEEVIAVVDIIITLKKTKYNRCFCKKSGREACEKIFSGKEKIFFKMPLLMGKNLLVCRAAAPVWLCVLTGICVSFSAKKARNAGR